MLKMPSSTSLEKSEEQPHYSQQQQQQHIMKNLFLESEQLAGNCYARPSDPCPLSSAVSVHSVCPSPLDQLMMMKVFSSPPSSSSSTSATATRCSSSKVPLGIGPLVKTPPALSSRAPTSYTNNNKAVPSEAVSLSSATFAGPQSLLEPSSLVVSTYAAATQLAAPMAAAAAAPWASSAWNWGAAAAATETAALLNGTYGTTTATTEPSNGGWNGAYFGNAFGSLMSNQFGNIGTSCFPSQLQQQQQQQITLSSTESNQQNSVCTVKNSLATMALQRSNKINETTEAPTATAPPSAVTTTSISGCTSKHQMSLSLNSRGSTTAAALGNGRLATKSAKQRPKGGGKMRRGGGNGVTGKGGGGKCECPNCKAGIYNKHNCHIAGCHKVYGKSSHLKAHLKWHVPERPTIIKKRLFDPPDSINYGE